MCLHLMTNMLLRPRAVMFLDCCSSDPRLTLDTEDEKGAEGNGKMKLGRIPVMWKTSCIVLVPVPSGLNNFRPVALTSPV